MTKFIILDTWPSSALRAGGLHWNSTDFKTLEIGTGQQRVLDLSSVDGVPEGTLPEELIGKMIEAEHFVPVVEIAVGARLSSFPSSTALRTDAHQRGEAFGGAKPPISPPKPRHSPPAWPEEFLARLNPSAASPVQPKE